MKITAQRLERWRAAITPLDTPELRAKYAARDIPRAHTVRDINRRYRFDLFGWALLRGEITSADAHDGLNDAHRETALRRIIPDIDSLTTPKEGAI